MARTISALVAVIAAPAAAVFDFTTFEDEVLPAWLARFTVSYSAGQFSYERVRGAAPVTLVQEDSTRACVLNLAFGCAEHSATMWVDKGCRGTFDCNGRAVVCASSDGARALCDCTAGPTPTPNPLHGTATLYGSVDVIHVLGTTGLLDTLNNSLRDAWAAQLGRYQNSSGFYDPAPSHNSLYHAMGEATASLALLGRKPRFNNSAYEAFATEQPTPAPSGGTEPAQQRWQRFFDGLYFNNCSGVIPGRAVGCGSSIHSCGQVIGSYPSVLAYTTGTAYKPFIDWWSGWIAARTNNASGTLCPLNRSKSDLYDSLGGGMATHGIQLGIAAGAPNDYSFELTAPRPLLNFALSLQQPDGAFDKQRDSAALGSMTLDGIFQAVRASEQLQRHGLPASVPEVMAACNRVLALSASQLNNASYVLDHWGHRSHDIANVVAAVGECARAFPQLVSTRRPWSCCARYV